MAMDQVKEQNGVPTDQITPAPDYSLDEQKWIGARIVEMVTTRNVRETPHDEFDGMTYMQRCEANRKGKNTYIAPKKNKEDTNFVTGSIAQKMRTYGSYLHNLTLDSEIRAYNSTNVEDIAMGTVLSETVEKTEMMDNDDEKMMHRQDVLLEQGEVFVQECWPEYYEKVKKVSQPFDGTNLKEFTYHEISVKKSNGPTRNILLNENVYLGDISVFDMQDQPFIFTVEQVPYEVAELEYGTWARWKHVPKSVKFLDQPIPSSLYNQNWSLTEVQKNHVEIVKYQCKPRNEYAIFINSVLMTPLGLPMPRKWGRDGESVRYDVEKQVLFLISPFFAYGKGLPAILKTKAYILDEMNRLAILKTQGSFQPARWNMTGVVLSSRIFMPGKVANGIDGTKIGTLTDANGMNRSELQMLQYLQKTIDDDLVSSAALTGQMQGSSRMSATQINLMKSQADLMMTLTLFAATMLETKLGTLRLYNVIENWFEPVDKVWDDTKKKLVDKYRSVNIDKVIPGQGPGQSITEISDTLPTPQDIAKRQSDIMKKTGKPTQLRVISSQLIKTINYSYYVSVSPKPKKNSDLTKVLFNDMLTQARTFSNLDEDYMSERFAVVWGEDPTKMFKKGGSGQPAPGGAGAPKPMGRGNRGKMMNNKQKQAGAPMKPNINTVAAGQ